MVRTLVFLPAVAAITSVDKPLAAIATEQKWNHNTQKGVCYSRTGTKGVSHHVASLLANPGAGMKPGDIEPFDRVLKDGFMKVKCVKDAMFNHGDKFGPNKHEYKYGATSNVSIVHYTAHVPKEDREKMTPEVCFNFCRTLDQMLFFGILNGRDCYCTPYFKAMASDDSTCDAVCEGDTSQTCGSQKKSNIWEMHMCNDAAQTLAEFSFNSHQLEESMAELIPNAESAAEGKNELGATLQAAFGKAGDPDAGGLMQKAKVAAGNLENLAADAEAERKKLAKLISDADALTGFRFGDFSANMAKELGSVRQAVTDYMSSSKIEKFLEFDTAKEGDELLAELEKQLPIAQKLYAELSELYLLSEPVVSTTLYMHSGNCILNEDTNCITPFTRNGRYQAGESCHFEILNGEADVEIKKMDTEGGYDPICMGGVCYSGGKGEGTTVRVSGDITWRSDCCVTRPGFEICVNPINEKKGEEGNQYYPIMYFVDKKFVNVAQTCNGDLIGSPIYFKNYHGCAGACDANNQECVGFAYFPMERASPTCASCFPSSSQSNTTLDVMMMLLSLCINTSPRSLPSCRRATAHSPCRRNLPWPCVLRSSPSLWEPISHQTHLARMTSS
jgi:hypothetical protein